MRRDIGNEVIVAIAVVGVLAFALMFAIVLSLSNSTPVATVLEAFGVDKDARGNAKASTDFTGGYATNKPKVFVAGDMRHGQSLVVRAIREGRQAARSVDEFLMGYSDLPR